MILGVRFASNAGAGTEFISLLRLVLPRTAIGNFKKCLFQVNDKSTSEAGFPHLTSHTATAKHSQYGHLVSRARLLLPHILGVLLHVSCLYWLYHYPHHLPQPWWVPGLSPWRFSFITSAQTLGDFILSSG